MQYASPATVSRAGMVFVDPKNLGYDPYWQRWLRSRPHPLERDYFQKLYELYVIGALAYILYGEVGFQQFKPLKLIVDQTGLNMVVQLCFMLDAMFPVNFDVEIDPESEIDEDLIESIYLVAIYNSLGASIVLEARTDFDTYIKKQCSKMGIDDKPEQKATTSKCKGIVRDDSNFFSFPRTSTSRPANFVRLLPGHREENLDGLEVARAGIRS